MSLGFRIEKISKNSIITAPIFRGDRTAFQVCFPVSWSSQSFYKRDAPAKLKQVLMDERRLLSSLKKSVNLPR